MTPQDFTIWLNGYTEINGKLPTSEQWKIIVEKLQTVFQKETMITLKFSGDSKANLNGDVYDCKFLENPFRNFHYEPAPKTEHFPHRSGELLIVEDTPTNNPEISTLISC